MKIGVVDTTFSIFDLAKYATQTIEKNSEHKIVRYTVPGIKDLPVACKILLDEGCDICISLGMVGNMPIDNQCAHEANFGLQQVQLLTNKHIVGVMIRMDEANDDKELYNIAKNRTEEHVMNVIALLVSKTELSKFSGKGKRQGKEDVGPFLI